MTFGIPLHVNPPLYRGLYLPGNFQRLAGASLLIFANKQDLPGALDQESLRKVCERATRLK